MKWIFAVFLSVLSVQLQLYVDKAMFPYAASVIPTPEYLRGIGLSVYFMITVSITSFITCLAHSIFCRRYISAIPAILALLLFVNFFMQVAQHSGSRNLSDVYFLALSVKLVFTPLAYLYSYKVSVNLVKLLTSLGKRTPFRRPC